MAFQCEVFQLDGPQLDDQAAIDGLTDPDQLRELYRRAGLTGLAANVDSMQKGDLAARRYPELSEADYELYAEYLSRHVSPDQVRPPVQAVVALGSANELKLFTTTTVLQHPETGESLLVAVVDTGVGMRRFKLAHWGNSLTGIKELRKRHRIIRVFARQLRAMLEWRPKIGPWPSITSRSNPVPYLLAFIVASVLSWGTLVLSGSWWLFMGMALVTMISCAFYVDEAPYHAAVKYIVGWGVGLSLVAGVALGAARLYQWNTASTTREVLVCNAFPRTNSGRDVTWAISTNYGNLTLEKGFYDGKYYRNSSESVARAMTGKWVRVTFHGHLSFDQGHPPYVSEGTTVRSGDCG